MRDSPSTIVPAVAEMLGHRFGSAASVRIVSVSAADPPASVPTHPTVAVALDSEVHTHRSGITSAELTLTAYSPNGSLTMTQDDIGNRSGLIYPRRQRQPSGDILRASLSPIGTATEHVPADDGSTVAVVANTYALTVAQAFPALPVLPAGQPTSHDIRLALQSLCNAITRPSYLDPLKGVRPGTGDAWEQVSRLRCYYVPGWGYGEYVSDDGVTCRVLRFHLRLGYAASVPRSEAEPRARAVIDSYKGKPIRAIGRVASVDIDQSLSDGRTGLLLSVRLLTESITPELAALRASSLHVPPQSVGACVSQSNATPTPLERG